MHSSAKTKPLKDHASNIKNNYSLKNLEPPELLKQIFQLSNKKLISNSTRNISNKEQIKDKNSNYFKKDLLSVENRQQIHKNKQNIKFPQIVKIKKNSQRKFIKPPKQIQNNSIFLKKYKQSQTKRKIEQNRQKIHTQPPLQTLKFHTVDCEQRKKKNPWPQTQDIRKSRPQKKTDIKQALLHILNSQRRNSITIQDQIDKLHQLTQKSGNLRVHLQSIQQDMLSLNLKKKISKINNQITNCSLAL